jgi:hypothetical protein
MGMFFVVVGLIFIAGGAVLQLRARARGAKAQAWPTTAGVVIASEVVTRAMGNSTVLIPVVTYRYEVAGAALESMGLRLGAPQFFNSKPKAEALAARYPVGSQVTVHYDPAAPATAALDPKVGGGLGPLMAYAFGATLAGLGLFAAIARV